MMIGISSMHLQILLCNDIIKKKMKVFRITTEVKSTKTIQYIIEANSQEEAELKIIEGEERGEGEEVDDEIEWGTEILTKTKFIEDLEE